MKKIKLEICCGNITDIIKIKDLDIDRIELNSALELGGLTPSIATLKEAKKITNIPIVCMVRNRGGGFIYNDDEINIMLDDAKMLIENGADGIVCGILNNDKTINIEAMKQMKAICKDKELIFHKAFDYIENKDTAIIDLINIGIKRILLMGHKDIDECAKDIAVLVDKYGHMIDFLPGGGINIDNISDVIDLSHTKEIHGTFKEYIIDKDTNEKHIAVSADNVKKIIEKIKNRSI